MTVNKNWIFTLSFCRLLQLKASSHNVQFSSKTDFPIDAAKSEFCTFLGEFDR